MISIYNFNNYFYDVIYWYTSYLTNWIITIILLFLFNIIPVNHIASVLYLSVLGMIGGLYITYISPRYISMPYFGGIKIWGYQLMFADFLTHMLPAIYLHNYIYKNGIFVKFEILNLVFGFLIGLIYLFLNNPCELYHLKFIDCCYIILLSFFMFNLINLLL